MEYTIRIENDKINCELRETGVGKFYFLLFVLLANTMTINNEEHLLNKLSGALGILAFSLFLVSLLVFGSLNPDFSFLNDVISKLGAQGQPLAIWWNIIGFVLVGILMVGFGVTYGKILNDRLISVLLSMFGLGFAFTAIPIEIGQPDSSISKAHIAVICLALAFWLFGLARMSYNPSLGKQVKFRANLAAILLVSSMIGFVLGFWSMPITHRLVFGVVFIWTFVTAIGLVRKSKRNKV